MHRRIGKYLIGLGLLSALVVAAAVAGAAVAPEAPPEPRDPANDVARPGSERIAVRVPDSNGQGTWAVARYVGLDGLPCVLAGEERGGQIGRTSGGRSDVASVPGQCMEEDPVVGVLAHNDVRATPQIEARRTLIYGLVPPQVVRVRVTGQREDLPVRDGAFLAVLDDFIAADELPGVELTSNNGAVRSYP